MMTEKDLQDLRQARASLESPGLLVQLSSQLGTGLEAVQRRLPRGVDAFIRRNVDAALQSSMNVAGRSLGQPGHLDGRGLHRTVAAASGLVGGFAGLPGLLLDLPVTTTTILRSIMSTARASGEDLTAPEARAACLEVLTLGGTSKLDDAAESGYFAARIALAQQVGAAARHVAEKGITEAGAPLLARLLTMAGSRFSVALSQKVAAQAVPVLGAGLGAALNLTFMNHYERMASGHFTVRRLERQYGQEIVRAAWDDDHARA